MTTLANPVATTTAAELGGALAKPRRSALGAFWYAFKKDKAAVGAAIALLAIITVAIAAPLVSPPDTLRGNVTRRLLPMGSPGALFGLDGQGRDMLGRLIWGGRTSIPNAIIPVAIAMAISMTLGATAAYVGGWADTIIMRVMDVFFAVPSVVLAVAIAGAMGRGTGSLILATTLAIIAPMTRVAYTATRTQVNMDYVLAARSLGAVPTRIVVGHLFPNVFAPVLVYGTTLTGLLVVFTASLSFLGLGVPPPTPDWGLMVDEGRKVLEVAPHVATLPGIVIAVVALCFNLVGDGLRFALDPRQRGA